MKKVIFLFIFFLSIAGFSQVTNSGFTGTVKSDDGKSLAGATVEAKHLPTGSKYYATTDKNGSFGIPSVRPGGPYTVKVTYVGFKKTEISEINAPLGSNINLNIVVDKETNALDEVVVKVTKSNNIFSKNRTGASQQFSNREINAVPVIGSRSITSITKYNANAGANGSFGGQDSRMNNFTIDGSVFNNGFGLGSDAQAGGRTGSTAISLDAIDQLQVNVAPYDIRQSGFTGSGINAVTRSGTNNVEGSVYHSFRNSGKDYIGTKAGEVEFVPTKSAERIWGARAGAPIIKDKLFFFGNFETVGNTSPATTWTSTGSPQPSGQISIPTYAQMTDMQSFMKNTFGYETGAFENFDKLSESKKFLARIDWNINDNNKFSIRYVHHDSSTDEPISDSNSGGTAGIGNRSRQRNAMSFKNSGYTIQDNTRSIVAELSSKISERWSNVFIAGYDVQIENRGLQGGGLFPTVDIRNQPLSSNNLISVGLDPFTNGNLLDYNTLHFTDNLTAKYGKHTFVVGANYERFVSNNSFFPGSNGIYVFNTIADFKAAALQSQANGGAPSTTALPVSFQYRYSAVKGVENPLQVLKSDKIDAYIQDEIKMSDNFKLTVGLRVTRVSFENTALQNPIVAALTFADGKKFDTGKMPNTQFLFEPRVGFNLDLKNDSQTQIRGGSGIFTGRPPFVFLSNAIGNNGVLTGFIDVAGAAVGLGNGARPYGFTANPAQYFTPSIATLPTTIDLALTASDFKFPQVWRSNVAIDQKLGFGFIGTLEGMYGMNINAINYYNANQEQPVGTFVGTDNRPQFARNNNGNRINDNVSNAIVLENVNNGGYFYSTTFKLDYPYKNGLFGSIAYTHSAAYDLMSAGSTAGGSFGGVRSVRGNNNISLAQADNITPHRLVGLLGYKINYGKSTGAATTFNLGYIGQQAGAFSYSYGADMNGDGITFNDLIYVPKNATEIRFQPLTVISTVAGVATTTIYTETQQQAAYNAYIDQDSYLSGRRGQYAERNSNVLPMLNRIDLSVTQDFFINISGKKNTFQFRADILNFGNLINKDWGLSQRATNRNVLNYRTTTGNVPFFQLATQTEPNGGPTGLIKDTFQTNASVFDVWQAQFTLRYIFGK